MSAPLDYLVVGAGPAGLQLGYYLRKSGRSFRLLERGQVPGSFFETYPRHRYLISINKVNTGQTDPELNLRWDWNSLLCDDPALQFPRYSSEYFPHPDDLVRYMADFARAYDLPIAFGTEVRRISRADGVFTVETAAGERLEARVVIVATGPSRQNVPTFPGAELCDTYATHSTDAEEYRNKRVLIVGKGNSGFETANHLTGTAAVIHVLSPESVRMAWTTHYVGNLRAVNNNFLDTYQLKSQNAVIDARIEQVAKVDGRYEVDIRYSHAHGQTKRLVYDRVILCTGFAFDASIFDGSCRPETALNGRYPAQTTAWESVNVPGMFFAGHLMHACDYRKTMSGFIHGFRYNVRTLATLLEERYHGRGWPFRTLPATTEAICGAIVARINQSSALFLQPGFMADVVVVDEASGEARYYEDVRRDHVVNSALGTAAHYYTVSLEYGKHGGDPFAIDRDPSPEGAQEAFYLHPIVRRFEAGRLVAEHHVNDDLENDWSGAEYTEPLEAFLRVQVGGAVARA